MSQLTGTHDISSLLAAKHQTVAAFGEDTVIDVLQRDMQAHNLLMQDILAELSVPSSDRQRLAGTSYSGEMVETDEYARAATQKATPGQTVAFPLKKFSYALGWTRQFLKKATPADLAAGQLAAQKAHRRRVLEEARKAIFLATNYTFYDLHVDNVQLAVKRLVNADSAKIPDGPTGEAFDGSTHTHYQARVSTLANSDVDALITDVAEHGHTRGLKLVINFSNLTAISGLSKFTPLTGPMVVPGSGSDRTSVLLDVEAPADNRLVGFWDGAYPIWVKPWAVANYVLCYAAGEDAKPLVERFDANYGRGLQFEGEIDLYPLRVDYMDAWLGFGVWTRTNGAVLYTGGTTWADPSL